MLLAALARLELRAPLRAVHVDHGLQRESAAWDAHCRQCGGALRSSLRGVRVTVPRDSGLGLGSGRARGALRGARRAHARRRGLLTAHHGDDQLETLLLRLMRGTGVRGLRGMLEHAPFGPAVASGGRCSASRAREIAAYASAPGGFAGSTIPRTHDPRHDRSYLRRDVVPALVARWPAARAQRAARSRSKWQMPKRFCDEVAERDAEPIAIRGSRRRAVLATLAPSAATQPAAPPAAPRGLGDARAHQKRRSCATPLLDARPDAHTRILWPGGEGRVFREHLYLMRALPPASRPGLSRPRRQGRTAGRAPKASCASSR